MKNIVQEYKRLRKLARVMEGKPGLGTIRCFMAKVDDDSLLRLRVSDQDRKKLKSIGLEEQLQVLVPYFEKAIRGVVEDKVKKRLQLGYKLAQTIAGKAAVQAGKVVLPDQPLRMLAQMHPSGFLVLENGKQVFAYPLAKLKQLLIELGQARVVWDLGTNQVRITAVEDRQRFACKLFPQPPYSSNGQPRFVVRIAQRRDMSISDLIYKAAEALIGL